MTDAELETVRAECAFLRRVVDNVSAILAYWDSSLRCRFANRACQRWFGVAPEALIGEHISELLGPVYQLNRAHIERALRGEPQSFERAIPDPAGGPPIESLINYVPDISDGVVRGFFALVSDVSEVKRYQAALKASEAKFSGIVSISSEAIISVDEDQRIIIFNKGAERIFGYAPHEVVGRRLDILLPPRLRTAHRRHVRDFAAGPHAAREMASNATVLGLHKDGHEFPAEAAISKLEIGANKVFTVALRDVTERKRVENEMQVLAEAGAVLASSLDYHKTLESIAHLVVRRAADLCIVDIAREGEAMAQLTVAHADPAKAAACDRLAALLLERRHTLGASAMESRQTQLFGDIRAELRAATAQDEEHQRLLDVLQPRSAMVAPLVSTGGVLGAIVFASSAPDRYGPRDLGFATELAHRAALAIENARLYEAERRATRARDEMLGIVAHDIRNPLASSYLAAGVLESELAGQGSARGTKSVRVILRSIDRASRLIQDLLDATRIEAGAFSVERDCVDANQVVRDAVESQRLLAGAREIDLRLEADEQLPQACADGHRLLQVIENLVGNAIKFTPRGGSIAIGVSAKQNDLLFWVADTGAGIAIENLPHLFDRFWRGGAEDRSAGLGLAICKGIVEAHAGRIWVDSIAGRGATFFFTIPIATRAAERPR